MVRGVVVRSENAVAEDCVERLLPRIAMWIGFLGCRRGRFEQGRLRVAIFARSGRWIDGGINVIGLPSWQAAATSA